MDQSSASNGWTTGSDDVQHAIFVERHGSVLAVPVMGWHRHVDLGRRHSMGTVQFNCLNASADTLPLSESDKSVLYQLDLCRARQEKAKKDMQKVRGSTSSSVSTSVTTGSPGSFFTRDFEIEASAGSDSSDEFLVPGLYSESEPPETSEGEEITNGYDQGTTPSPGTPSIITPYNSLEAHQKGICKPCRFFHMKKEGCRIGDACTLAWERLDRLIPPSE
eukprot:Skav209935  [mRNA]  locus=scaffold102:141748:146764:+ [translate_table: standard]